MPFSGPNDASLPEHIKKQTPPLRAKWVQIFNSILSTNGEEMAFIVANKWLLRQVSEKTTMARTEGTEEKVSLVIKDYTQMVSRTHDGNIAISFKLADVFEDKFGIKIPESILQKWETKLNSGSILGDVDHEAYDQLMKQNLSDEEFTHKLENKPSIARSIKGVFEKGKLWVKAIIDKTYESILNKTKGVSMEASLIRDTDGNIIDGELHGFTFGVAHSPVIDGTEVHANVAA